MAKVTNAVLNDLLATAESKIEDIAGIRISLEQSYLQRLSSNDAMWAKRVKKLENKIKKAEKETGDLEKIHQSREKSWEHRRGLINEELTNCKRSYKALLEDAELNKTEIREVTKDYAKLYTESVATKTELSKVKTNCQTYRDALGSLMNLKL